MIDPCTFVIFGATGNLSQKKLMPALYHLEQAGRLPADMRVLGVGRREWDDEAWRNLVEDWVSPRARAGLDQDVWARFRERLHFFRGDLKDEDVYRRLGTHLAQPEYSSNVAFYMSLAPAEYAVVSVSLLHGTPGCASPAQMSATCSPSTYAEKAAPPRPRSLSERTSSRDSKPLLTDPSTWCMCCPLIRMVDPVSCA